MVITLSGNYSVKVKIFGISLYKKAGSLHEVVKVPEGSLTFSKSFKAGPFTVTVAMTRNPFVASLTISLAGTELYSQTYPISNVVGATTTVPIHDITLLGDKFTNLKLEVAL